MTQKTSLENTQLKQDDDVNKIIEQQTLKTTQIINDNNLSLDNSLQTSQSLTIDPQNLSKEQQPIRKWKMNYHNIFYKFLEDNFQQSSLESDTFRWTEHPMISFPKTHLEDALFKFLEQANLLQYYSAFIKQGITKSSVVKKRSIIYLQEVMI
jgi:hypothetical protein